MKKIFASGIFPRSDELIKKINKFEQKNETFESLKHAFENDERFWLESQSGLSVVSEPALAWNDIFRPFTLNLENVETGPLTRYLETNTFFRRPIVKGKPEKKGSLMEWKNEYGLQFIFDRNSKVILPGPYSFLKVSEIKAELDEKKLLEIFSEIIFSEAKNFNFVEFKEPFIQHIEDLKNATDIYSTCSSKGYVFTEVFSNDFIDFPLPYAIKTENFSELNENIVVEMIDVFSTKVENFSEKYDFQITTNESLEFLPFKIAKLKIDFMKNLLEAK